MFDPEYPLRRPEAIGAPVPATGGWREGVDPPAWRRIVTVCEERCFALEGGGRLDRVDVAYESWGSLDASGSNAVLVCHALTGDAHAAGPSGPGQRSTGWWDDMIGPGKPLDTDRYFVVCMNVLGGCGGTTGPMSPHPDDGKPYGARFPVVTPRDIVRSQAMLADHLGIGRWLSVVGGSMGGMQALEWATMFPERVASLAVIASAPQASAMQIGWSATGRLAIVNDAKWNGGDYYDAEDGEGPHEGLALARRIAQLHYRADASLENRFARTKADKFDQIGLWNRFQVESYLDHHGMKLTRRFDANSYLVLNKAMDLHDLGHGRGGLGPALARVNCPTLIVSIDSDILYTPRQQHELRDMLVEHADVPVSFGEIVSDHGHDGFLIEFDQLGPMVDEFVSDQFKAGRY